MVLCQKKQKHCEPEEWSVGDCWIALSLAKASGLVLSGRIGKHTDKLAQALIEAKLPVTLGKPMAGKGTHDN